MRKNGLVMYGRYCFEKATKLEYEPHKSHGYCAGSCRGLIEKGMAVLLRSLII